MWALFWSTDCLHSSGPFIGTAPPGKLLSFWPRYQILHVSSQELMKWQSSRGYILPKSPRRDQGQICNCQSSIKLWSIGWASCEDRQPLTGWLNDISELEIWRWERRLQSLTPSVSPPQPSSPASGSGNTPCVVQDNPTQLGWTRLSPEERQHRQCQGLCIYCGGAGHYIAKRPDSSVVGGVLVRQTTLSYPPNRSGNSLLCPSSTEEGLTKMS